MTTNIIIEKASDVRQLAKRMSMFRVNRGTINVQIPYLPEEENEELQKEITKHYGACGCSQGRIAGIVTFVGYTLMVVTGIISIYRLGIWKTLLGYFMVSFVSMLVVKSFAIRNARKSLEGIASQLQLVQMNTANQ